MRKIVVLSIICLSFIISISAIPKIYKHIKSAKIYILPSPDHGGGLFHNFLNVLGFLDYIEHNHIKNYKVDFGNQGHYYDNELGSNWWTYYFEPVCHNSFLAKFLYPAKRTKKRINSDMIAAFIEKMEKAPREHAHTLITQHIVIKPDIQKAVDEYISDNFKTYNIGIHFRGTDKVKKMKGYANPESRVVEYSEIFDNVDELIKKVDHNDIKIFVATDSQPFLMAMKNKYKDFVIHTSAIRSNNERPLHYNVNTNIKNYHYIQGKETVIDCLLLSRCNVMIVTSSNLNLCAGYFNPDIPIISLSEKW